MNKELRKITGLFRRRRKTLENDTEQLTGLLGSLWKKEDTTPEETAGQLYEQTFSAENDRKYMNLYKQVMTDLGVDPHDEPELEEDDEESE